MSFGQPYPKYKDSGVEWLGEVPEHWSVRHLKRNLALVTEKATHRTNPIALENVESWTGRFVSTETEFQGDGVAFESGDLLFGKLRPYLAKALLAAAAGEAIGDFHVMRPGLEINPRFAQYYLLNHGFIHVVDGSTYGAKMPRASWSFVASMAMATPPVEEQDAIADYLDRATTRIDTLIAKKTRFIELLHEKRQALITRAVAKGLDDSVPMKDSGVEWLGEVPEHWEIRPLKTLLARNDGGAWGSDPVGSGDTMVLRSTEQTADGLWKIEAPAFRNLSVTEFEATRLEENDLLITKSSGSSLHIGKATLVTSDIAALNCSFSNFMQRLRTVPKYEPKLAWYVLNNDIAREQFELLSKSTTGLANLNGTIIGEIVCPVPPRVEQKRIIESLDRATARIDSLITKTEQSIALLQEKRSALITAAVTGKIDLRQAA